MNKYAIGSGDLRLPLPWLWLIFAIILMFALHISVGAKSIPVHEVINALLRFDDQNFEHVVIWQLRLPRAVLALIVGASLSVAGALMQGITRNALAEPSILGLLHGASLAVVLLVSLFGVNNIAWIPLFAAIGALIAALLVWIIATSAPGGATPITLILSGAAVTAFLSAFIALIKLIDQDTFENLRVWLTGSLAGRDLAVLGWCSPWIIAGLIMALMVSRHITTFAMGEEAATGLGIEVGRLKAMVLFSVIALTASSVALVGPLGFVGLVIPHIVRLFVGHDYRRIVPYTALVGSLYLISVDILARIMFSPVEISTGIITSLIGAPLFVWLVRVKL